MISLVRKQLWSVVALAALLPLGGCLFRTHKVERRASTATLQEATRDQLVEHINAEAAKIRSMNATVDIAPAVGGEQKGKVTEYQEIRGYILVRKPQMIRMIGLFPVVRNKAFDMVSDGQTFRVSIPTRNRFIVGRNDVVRPAKQPLENLRPQHIFDALLLQEIDPQNEIAVVEGGSEIVRDTTTKKYVDEPNYILTVVRRGANGAWILSRKLIINRVDLTPYRQIVYDKLGNVATDATYDNFKDFDGVRFPALITIRRPQEEYVVQIGMVKLKLNDALRDDQFQLAQPPGSQLVRLDEPGSSAAKTPPGGDGSK